MWRKLLAKSYMKGSWFQTKILKLNDGLEATDSMINTIILESYIFIRGILFLIDIIQVQGVWNFSCNCSCR